MSSKLTLSTVALLSCAWLMSAGCAGGDKSSRADDGDETATPVARDEATPATAAPDDIAASRAASLVGTVIKKPWSKSAESWNAGGSEYYVLDVGDAPVEDRSAEEGVILRATDTVSAAALDAMVGQRVRVEGVYVEARPYTPKDPTEQYPTGMNGEPVPRGSGFAVSAIAPAE